MLLEARLAPVMESARLATGHELLRALVGPRSELLRERVLDRVTTHETSFFRDRGPFDALRDRVFPELAVRLGRARPIRVWCAACSTGQEPYSVAMLARESAPGIANHSLEILATDVSRDSVARAYSGVYSQMEVNRGLSPERLRRYMEPEGRHWRVTRPIREMVMFRQHNLVLEPPPLGGFDVVLCRNVLMYFGLDVRPRVFAALHDALHPGGYLFLGAAESPAGGDLRFEHFGPRDHYCYRRSEAQVERAA
ncbi:MAG: protein-glutamate O-methyltransferase CheR [Candidatus Eisenbacteria bacterium]|nr:protein-glutamate O-methyltransferase CheR [Candidatus Eisenbacteria bacterium]